MEFLEKSDVVNMIQLIKANYPYAYKDIPTINLQALIETWFRILNKYPKEIVMKSFQMCLEVCKMPPTIADITEQIGKIKISVSESETELWNKLHTAIKKTRDLTYFGMREFYYGEELIKPQEKLKEIFDKLPMELKEYVFDTYGLIALAKLDTLEFEKARFMKSINTIRERNKVKEEINPSILRYFNSDLIEKPKQNMIDKIMSE